MATIKQNTPNAHTRILGIGAYRPSEIVTNDDVCQWIESSDEWIVKRTGIHTRHRAPADVTVLEMAEHSAREALESAGLTGEQLDTIIVSTVSFPYLTPSLAAQLADRLGATPAAAYDISAACAGYCYGIAQADALVRSGDSTNVLVIGVENSPTSSTTPSVPSPSCARARAWSSARPTSRESARPCGVRTDPSGMRSV